MNWSKFFGAFFGILIFAVVAALSINFLVELGGQELFAKVCGGTFVLLAAAMFAAFVAEKR